MDKDLLRQMEQKLDSGDNTEEVLRDMINHVRANNVQKEADTSLEEMIDDFLESAEKANQKFKFVKQIYYELRTKDELDYDSSYLHVKKNYLDVFSDFDNLAINKILSGITNDHFRTAILSCAINYSDLDRVVICEDVSNVRYFGDRLGDGGYKKRVIVEGSVGSSCGVEMSNGEIYVKGDAGFLCGSAMSGGKITVTGSTTYLCGCEMTGGEIQINGNAGSSCGSGMSNGKIIVYGDVLDCCGSRMSGGEIYVKGSTGHSCGEEMSGGEIHIDKSTDSFCGSRMSGGEIYIKEDAKEFCGSCMSNGIIDVGGNVGEYCGCDMKNGEIYVDGNIQEIRKAKKRGKIFNKGKVY